jgi:wyosine [tRNA(Phe)-imidazoG37] synthetase (radical SAM superfamily)
VIVIYPNESSGKETAPTGCAEGWLRRAQSGPRWLGNRFVYAAISQRARGLSIGVNLNPDKRCSFDCVYCEVDRDTPGRARRVDVEVMAAELERLLLLQHEGKLGELDWFRNLPPELLELKEVALSGYGEPTLCPNFDEVVREVLYLRSTRKLPFFKTVLITNGTGLDLPPVTAGLDLLCQQDEIWVKLDAGTQAYYEQVNRPTLPFWRILANILALSKKRPVVIQSLFPLVNGQEPPWEEIDQYAQRLKELKAAGAQISLVQVYSAHRPPPPAQLRIPGIEEPVPHCFPREVHHRTKSRGFLKPTQLRGIKLRFLHLVLGLR